jgi:CubicO group peptidase (beta-lactamase class C family)
MTFNTGIKYDEKGDDWNSCYNSYNWNKNFLSRPFNHMPGTHFNYESPSAHLLSTIISKLTGKSALSFADEFLFSKLGISLPYWEYDNFNINTGGWGLSMIPRDMAKIGYLMINNGSWDGEQILPENWVDTVTSIYSKAPFAALWFVRI